MSKLVVYNVGGAVVGDLEIADALLVRDKGGQAVHDAVLATLAGRRAGTASTLRKGEVAGSNKKPWRQKGTGRARAGYRQSPVWRGGGVPFGPHPRSYAQKVNKKVMRLAFRRAFSDKVVSGGIRVLEDMVVPEGKTRAFASLMKSLAISGPALFVTDNSSRTVALAARNIPGVEVVGAKDVGVYQLVRYPVIVITKAAMGAFMARIGDGGEVAQ